MSDPAHLPSISAGAPRAVPAARPAPGAPAGPAFEALLERLTQRAAELEQKSKALGTADELPGAVDAARASLEDALQLGTELLEAYRAARQGGGSSQP